jgi:hypothetical protein
MYNPGQFGPPPRPTNQTPSRYGSSGRGPYSTGYTNTTNFEPYGFGQIGPGPGGGLSYQADPNSRPYWANPSYLYGGMGGMRPGMSIPNYADYYRSDPRYEANHPQPQPYTTNVVTPENSAAYLSSRYPDLWNPDGTPRGVTATSGPNGHIPLAPPRNTGYYGGGMRSSGGYGGGYSGGSTRGGMMGSYSGGGSQGRGSGGYGGMMGGFMGGRY